MIAPIIPIDEARRLFALRRLQILDTEAEPAFDHITSLAQQLFAVPIALISLVDKDRQWFKSRIGLDATETPREISFCGHAILNEEIFVINDAIADERFHDNPFVTGEPHVRFYAGAPLHAPDGERIGTLCIIDRHPRDLTRIELEPLRALARIIDDMFCRSDDVLRTAYYDELTGLPNKLLLQDKLKQVLAAAEAIHRSVAVFAISIDHLRAIKQTHDQSTADEFVKGITSKLLKIAGSSALVSRISDEEFIAVPVQEQEHASIAQFAHSILAELTTPIRVHGIEISTPVSIGAGIFPDHGSSVSTLLAVVHTALSTARNDGGNTFHIYSQELSNNSKSHTRIYNELRQALAQHEFELHYLPEVDLADGKIIGIETLLRWNHPRLGLLRPADFLDIAEESGLIVPIGAWILEAACRQAEAWRERGHLTQPLSVNISALQFKRPDFVELVGNVLTSTQLPASYLELELTESMLTGDNEKTLERIRELQGLGVRLTLDDFGSGHCNLAQLQRFAFHKVKIDESYIRQLQKPQEDHGLIKAVIDLAQNLKLTISANGVETVTQLQRLRELGCRSAQGALFSKACRASAMHSMLLSQQMHSTPHDRGDAFGLSRSM